MNKAFKRSDIMILTTFCVEARLRWNKRKCQEKSRLEDYYSGSEER